ncbi:hypothetical protein BU14_0142s0026 [Porphyra umbilicalis]|uniref:MYND-type domain-containing protein n=1 Tax=Porphyra umbilicalis TaxID=2786 RepID=A0A1X6PA58_PORUM|nr:hypothetical protein BU14_0142s0026 [Porphyra umbilicalis]|eukprot:OSX77616.1 hypothetical protein BU14_0142s0026 [Porphyra umbilicalis]
MALTSPALPRQFWDLVDGGTETDLVALRAYLAPATCHRLINDAAAATALVRSFTTCARQLMSCYNPHSSSHGQPDRAHWGNRTMKRWEALDKATGVCHCGDDAVLDALVEALPVFYTPGCLVADTLDTMASTYVTLLDKLIDRTAERPEPVGGDRRSGPCTRGTWDCGPPDDDTTRRERLARLASAPLVLRMSAEWLKLTVTRRCANYTYGHEPAQALAAFAIGVPCAVLNALPSCMAKVVDHAEELATAHLGAKASTTFLLLLRALEALVAFDATGFRKIRSAPKVLATLARAASSANVNLADRVLTFLCIYGVQWEGLVRVPSVLRLLVEYATSPPVGVPAGFDIRAAELALHVAAGAASSRTHPCGNDHKLGFPSRSVSRCSGCGVAQYCSSDCSEVSWESGHSRACKGWSRLGKQAVDAEAARLASTAGPSHSKAPVPRLRPHAVVYNPTQVDLTGNWRTDWSWPAAKARQVEEAGLTLRDVVCLIDIEAGAVVLAPAEAYVHWPGAVPREKLDVALEKHNGRMLRVIYREYPHLVRSFGPVSLGLTKRPTMTAGRTGGSSRREAPASGGERDPIAAAVLRDLHAGPPEVRVPADVQAEVQAWHRAKMCTLLPDDARQPVLSLRAVHVVKPAEDPEDPPRVKVRLVVRGYEHAPRHSMPAALTPDMVETLRGLVASGNKPVSADVRADSTSMSRPSR